MYLNIIILSIWIISQQIYQVYNCQKFIILEGGKVVLCIVVSSHVEETFTYAEKSLFRLLVIIFLFGMTSLSRYYYFCQVLQFSLNVFYWILEFKFSNYPSGRKFSKAGNRTFSRHIENCFDLIFSLDENVKQRLKHCASWNYHWLEQKVTVLITWYKY